MVMVTISSRHYQLEDVSGINTEYGIINSVILIKG